VTGDCMKSLTGGPVTSKLVQRTGANVLLIGVKHHVLLSAKLRAI